MQQELRMAKLGWGGHRVCKLWLRGMSGKGKWCRDESKPQASSWVFQGFFNNINPQVGCKMLIWVWSQFGASFTVSLPAWSRSKLPICTWRDQNSWDWSRVTHSALVKTTQHNHHLFLKGCLENLEYFLISDTFRIVYGAHAVLAQAWLVVVDHFVASVSIKKNREIRRLFQSLNLTLIISSNRKRNINLTYYSCFMKTAATNNTL